MPQLRNLGYKLNLGKNNYRGFFKTIVALLPVNLRYLHLYHIKWCDSCFT